MTICQVQFISEDESPQISSEIYRVWKLYAMSLVMWTCQNNLGFSLYAIPSIYYIVATSDEWMKSKMEVSTDLVCCY